MYGGRTGQVELFGEIGDPLAGEAVDPRARVFGDERLVRLDRLVAPELRGRVELRLADRLDAPADPDRLLDARDFRHLLQDGRVGPGDHREGFGRALAEE